ncbi:hypothetical protein [Galenea microaerophila]
MQYHIYHKQVFNFILLLFISSVGTQALAESKRLPTGLMLVNEANCMRCHSEKTFHYGPSKMENLKHLHQQVKRCESNLKIGWFEDEMHDVTDYLNTTFYHFSNLF